MSRRPFKSKRQIMLAEVAKETKAALPGILQQLSDIDATASSVHKFDELQPLDASKAPRAGQGFTTKVVNADTLDTAINLSKEASSSRGRVAVLNLASERSPGGGWLGGALAQEESICYRSSLALSLHKKYYPLGHGSAIYSPDCVIIREEFSQGHKLLKDVPPTDLNVVSVLSVAALRRPATTTKQTIIAGEITERETFAKAEDRELTKMKMRLTLRLAATKGHTRLVLGALGCGAFQNPTEDVAACWREVLNEQEFCSGWFEHVVFAVLDKGSAGTNAGKGGKGNFDAFATILGDVRFGGET